MFSAIFSKGLSRGPSSTIKKAGKTDNDRLGSLKNVPICLNMGSLLTLLKAQ